MSQFAKCHKTFVSRCHSEICWFFPETAFKFTLDFCDIVLFYRAFTKINDHKEKVRGDMSKSKDRLC